jgi:CRP-like cAMP-binding protein
VSVLDQFRDAEQRVAQRLKELEPAVAEYRELEAVAKQLGIKHTATAKPASAVKPTATRRRSTRKRTPSAAKAPATQKPAPRRSRSNSRPGQREQQVLELVRGRPGITVREVGNELGVDPTGLYRVVGRLEQRGELRKTGRNLQPIAKST